MKPFQKHPGENGKKQIMEASCDDGANFLNGKTKKKRDIFVLCFPFLCRKKSLYWTFSSLGGDLHQCSSRGIRTCDVDFPGATLFAERLSSYNATEVENATQSSLKAAARSTLFCV